MKYIYTVIEKQAANEISLEINKNAQTVGSCSRSR